MIRYHIPIFAKWKTTAYLSQAVFGTKNPAVWRDFVGLYCLNVVVATFQTISGAVYKIEIRYTRILMHHFHYRIFKKNREFLVFGVKFSRGFKNTVSISQT
jgi:hypothetical protein